MQPTHEQLEAIRSGASVRLAEGDTDLVLVRADVLDRLRDLIDDDSPWTDEEMDLLAAADCDALGWEGMEAYQSDAP